MYFWNLPSNYFGSLAGAIVGVLIAGACKGCNVGIGIGVAAGSWVKRQVSRYLHDWGADSDWHDLLRWMKREVQKWWSQRTAASAAPRLYQ
jgi:hypothetical protein